MAAASVGVDFALPASLEATAPPEARGLRRDEVRLLVSDVARGTIEHARFYDLPRFLVAGDTLVVNTSGTLNAALDAVDASGTRLRLHLSTRLPAGFWVVEVRVPSDAGSLPHRVPLGGERLRLPEAGEAAILAPYPLAESGSGISRLWLAALRVPFPLPAYLERHGSPIRYGYVKQAWPWPMYQTVFATEPGSAEMPSAGRPFTSGLVTTLVARGVQIAPVLLHTGVSSLEGHEPPYEEFFRISSDAAARITAARRLGGRIVAVGTTVVRALESATDSQGITSPAEGWTDVIVPPTRPIRAVDGIITGLHEPRATHLMLLEQVVAAARRAAASRGSPRVGGDAEVLARAYAEAIEHGYLWHEFGDSHLVVATRE
jgi:S-adenosylmethionine:tRNA ribosyltransferase-isomerase